jgi:hypothetical protein
MVVVGFTGIFPPRIWGWGFGNMFMDVYGVPKIGYNYGVPP